MTTATTAPEFTPGDKAVWTGLKGLFERSVTIREVRRSYLAIFGETPDDAEIVYDIHDAEVIKGVILGIPAEQLKAAANPAPAGEKE